MTTDHDQAVADLEALQERWHAGDFADRASYRRALHERQRVLQAEQDRARAALADQADIGRSADHERDIIGENMGRTHIEVDAIRAELRQLDGQAEPGQLRERRLNDVST